MTIFRHPSTERMSSNVSFVIRHSFCMIRIIMLSVHFPGLYFHFCSLSISSNACTDTTGRSNSYRALRIPDNAAWSESFPINTETGDLPLLAASLAPHPLFMEALPREQLAGVLLARRCDVGMREDALWRDRMPAENIATEIDNGFDLSLGERFVSEFVAGICDFDANRARVDVSLSSPVCDASVVRTATFIDQAQNPPVFKYEIMARNL